MSKQTLKERVEELEKIVKLLIKELAQDKTLASELSDFVGKE